MKFVICIILASISLTAKLFSQTVTLDSIQIERVASVGQLWGHLKYFHPFLDDPAINWESAFTDNIEEIIESENNGENATAVQKMLARLNDPVTKVSHEVEPYVDQDTLKYPIIKFMGDNVLLVAVRDYRDLLDRQYTRSQFIGLKGRLHRSSANELF